MNLSKVFDRQTVFLLAIFTLVAIAGVITNNTVVAMWFGFALAGYSAISNDSIQTLGTFISSNKKVKWYWLWLFLGGILIFTIANGWIQNAGDISYGRLNKIPQPETFSFWQLLAPIVLLLITRFKIPVSTTFLLLAVFSSSKTLGGMINKTLIGYLVAFAAAIVFWSILAFYVRKFKKDKYRDEASEGNLKMWRVFQWCATAFLWYTWLSHDSANAAVFLPRTVSLEQLIIVVTFLFFGLGYILYKKGGPIQTIIQEKTDIVYVKSATLIDLVYGFVLVYFKQLNDLPMSTTWVFLGLLAGRELALTQLSGSTEPYKKSLSLVVKDLFRAGLGLVLSIGLAYLANPTLFDKVA
jgi:hypothetical protein